MQNAAAITRRPLIGSGEHGVYMLDPAGMVASWSPGAERFMGYPASEILGQHLSRFYTTVDQAAGVPEAALETAARTGAFEGEGWRVRRDGEQFWADVVIEPIRDGAGHLVGFAEISRDTSERKPLLRANPMALQPNANSGGNETQLRRMIEAAPNAVVVVDVSGRIVMVNVQTEQLFGCPRGELLGNSVEILLPTASGALFVAPTAHPLGAVHAMCGLKRDGKEIQLEVGLSPIETDQGNLVLAAIVDISARVRLEEQLRQSQKMDAIGRVAAGVAHDFNNLLQALGGSLEMMLDAVADRPAALEWGNVALRATTRGKELTHRLLSFAREQVLIARPVRVEVLFRELKELIAHLFEASIKGSIELVMLPGEPGLGVLADLAQLEAALINLAVNARDAMADGGRVCISACGADADPAIVPPGRYTVISVSDNGGGMDASTLAQACEPFFTTKGPDGTGLGLSMVQGFARQSDGDMHISSLVGEGTTVDLWLPAAGLAAAVELPAKPIGPAAGHILLIDDSSDSLLVVSAFLRRAGLMVTAQTSGDLALGKLARGERFDVLVTDLAMPGMNGLELLTLAREIDPAMAVLVITGFADCKAMPGLNDVAVLNKPFGSADLAEAVHKLVATRRE